MARSLWSGSLSFGLVNVPVRVLSAVRDQDLHFHQIHEKDGARIEIHRYCSKEDVEVDFEDIGRSYEFEDGSEVMISDEELEAVEPRKTRTIDIEQFLDTADVDPILFDHPYFLVPASEDEGATRAYRLLCEAMAKTERAALGRFVMRAKEYLAIIRVRDGALTLTTMVFGDEVRPRKEVVNGSGKAHKPTTKQLEAAVAVIEELSDDWDPDKHKDRYRARLRRVVERKRKGETIRAPSAPEPSEEGPDLMAALERTLEQMRGRSSAKKKQRQEA